MWSSHRGHPTIGEDGQIELLRQLSQDPIGTLWHAKDAHFHRTVTVRAFRDELGTHQRFMQVLRSELSRVWPRLKHQHVARAITFVDGPDRPTLHVVMEALEGETLAERLDRSGPIEPVEARRIEAQVGAALDAAHAIGLVHGGLTPHSVFLTPRDGVKVLDFGIPDALWATAREAGEAIGDGDVALLLDRSRDARDLELLVQRMLSGHPASGEFDLRRLIDLVLASPSETSATAARPVERSRRRPRSRRRHVLHDVGAAMKAWGNSVGAWGGRVRDSIVDAGHAVGSVPRRAAQAVRRFLGRTGDAVADALPGAASVPGRAVGAVTRPFRGMGRHVASATRAVAAAPGGAVRAITRPLRPAGRQVAGAARAAAAAPRRAAPATGRLLRRAMVPLLGGGAAVLVLVVAVALITGTPTTVVREQPAASTAPSPPPTPPTGAEGVVVPDVNGLSPMEAGALLTRMGLSVVDAEPAPGPPGKVVGTDPAVNEVVDPTTPIVLLVGTSPERTEGGG